MLVLHMEFNVSLSSAQGSQRPIAAAVVPKARCRG